MSLEAWAVLLVVFWPVVVALMVLPFSLRTLWRERLERESRRRGEPLTMREDALECLTFVLVWPVGMCLWLWLWLNWRTRGEGR